MVSPLTGPDTPLSKPRDNEIYHRFQNFLQGGPRIVIPDAENKCPAQNQHRAATQEANLRSDTASDNGIKDASPGSMVEIHGLQAKPELNGRSGTIIGFDSTAARYQVQLDHGGPKLIKPCNLKLLSSAAQHQADRQVHQRQQQQKQQQKIDSEQSISEPARPTTSLQLGMLVYIVGSRDPSLEMQEGTLAGYDVRSRHWRVLMNSGAEHLLHPSVLKPLVSLFEDATAVPETALPVKGAGHQQVTQFVDLDDDNGTRDLVTTAWQAAEVYSAKLLNNDIDDEVKFVSIRASDVGVDLETCLPRLHRASDILACCYHQTEESYSLSAGSVARAFQEMRRCPDFGMARADARFSRLLAHLQGLLNGDDVNSADLDLVLSALADCSLPSNPMAGSISRCVLQRANEFSVKELVSVVANLAILGLSDVKVFDVLAVKLLSALDQLPVASCVMTATAFARARLQHLELLDGLGTRVTALAGSLGDEDLIDGAYSFAQLDVMSVELHAALCTQVEQRSERLGPSQLLRLVGSLTSGGGARWAASSDGSGHNAWALSAAWAPACTALTRTAKRLLPTWRLSDLGLLQLALLWHALPDLQQVTSVSFLGKVKEAEIILSSFNQMPPSIADEWGAARFVTLRGLFSAAGDPWPQGVRHVLAHICRVHGGKPEFVKRAMSSISWAAADLEDWNVRVWPQRDRAYVEYRWCRCGMEPINGDMLTDDRPRHAEPLPSLLEEPLSHGVLDAAELCALAWVLCDLYDLAHQAGMDQRAEGSLSMFLDGRFSLPALMALWRLQALMPRIVMSMSVSACDTACHVVGNDPEVLDFDVLHDPVD